MALKVRLAPLSARQSRRWYDEKTNITLTPGVTSDDLTNQPDLTNVAKSVVAGTLQVVEGTVADLMTLVGNIF